MSKEIAWLLNDKYNGIETAGFSHDVARLTAGEPLAYVIGWVPFLGTKIYLDSKPLIPRPETEFWVEKAIKEIKAKGLRNPKVLDLCTGSGCIGVAVLKEIPESTVHFAEIDVAHHSTIKKNILENDIELSRTKIFDGDLFENIKETYDVILSNPPYINPLLKEEVAASVRNFEPGRALYGGEDGLEIIIRLLSQVPKHLSHEGFGYIEHEPEQVLKLRNLALSLESFQDQYKRYRYSWFDREALIRPHIA